MRSEIIKPIDDIAEHIVESQDEQAALEFTKVIGKLLKENGVSIYGTKYKDDAIRQIRHGYKIEMLDFFEHDKEVSDKLFLQNCVSLRGCKRITEANRKAET